MDICWQSNVSAFYILHSFSPKEQVSSNFRVAVTICSDFGAQEIKVCHCFPIYLPWSDGTDAMILVFWLLSIKPDFSLSSFIFYGNGQMYNMCPRLLHYAEYFHSPEIILCSNYSPYPWPPAGTTGHCAVSLVWSFPECHTVGIIKYVTFPDWFLSLSSIHLTLMSFHGNNAIFIRFLNYKSDRL